MAKLRLFFLHWLQTYLRKSRYPLNLTDRSSHFFSTERRTTCIDLDMIHNQASNKSFRIKQKYIPQGARAENMFFMIYLLRDSEIKIEWNDLVGVCKCFRKKR